MMLAGIDVSSRTLTVALETAGRQEIFEVANTEAGHRRLCQRLTRRNSMARVALEPTGSYSLAPALALKEAGVDVMMVNPKKAQRFASLLERSKTDILDAQVLLSYLKRMPFVSWQAPSRVRLELQAMTRRMAALIRQQTQEKNRRHAQQGLSPVVLEDLEASLASLSHRVQQLEGRARRHLAQDEELERHYKLLISVKGIARRSALLLLGELALLPAGLSARQWVAHAGLDPRHFQSGSSVHKPSHISRCGNAHLRRALYMPALVASSHEPRIRAFYQELLARGKVALQALTAVMRKLLHSLFGIFKNNTPFEGEKFRALPTPAAVAEEASLAQLGLAEPRLAPVALPHPAAEARVLGQGRRSRRSEPLTQKPPRPSSSRRRGSNRG